MEAEAETETEAAAEPEPEPKVMIGFVICWRPPVTVVFLACT